MLKRNTATLTNLFCSKPVFNWFPSKTTWGIVFLILCFHYGNTCTSQHLSCHPPKEAFKSVYLWYQLPFLKTSPCSTIFLLHRARNICSFSCTQMTGLFSLLESYQEMASYTKYVSKSLTISSYWGPTRRGAALDIHKARRGHSSSVSRRAQWHERGFYRKWREMQKYL